MNCDVSQLKKNSRQDSMSMLSLIVGITLRTSIAVAIITPNQLYEMVDNVVTFYMNDSCLVVISSGGYTAADHIPAVYVDPYNQKMEDINATANPEESYKMITIAPALEVGCVGFLVQVENPGRQLRLIEETFVRVNDRIQRRFIFLPTITRVTKGSIGAQDEVLDSNNFELRSILREKSLQYIPDVIFTIPNDEDDHVAIVTHHFTGPEELCHQEMLLDTYLVTQKRFNLGITLFPDKVKDLEGKVLKVATFHYPPYAVVISDDDQKKDISNRIDGTEWRFVVEFAKLHNFSLQAVIDNEGAWGHIYENVTGIGVTGNLVEDKADLGITALYTWYYESHYLDLTTPFYRSGITCLVPVPRQLPQWKSPIRPFSPTLWATFIGMMMLSALFAGLVNQVESIIRSEDSFRMSPSEATLTVVGIILLQGLAKDPEGSSWAVFSVTLLIESLLISTAYGSSLASAITVPRYEAPIDTAFDLAARGIPWGATSDAWIFSILNAEEPELRTLVKNFQELSPAKLTKYSDQDDDWAFSIERLQSGHYSIQDYLRFEAIEKMHLMKSDIYWEYCVSMLRKSSPFTKWFSQRILEIQASGIPAYWETDVVLQYLDIRKQLTIDTEDLGDGGPIKMTAQQVQGTFFILAIGLVLSGLVFLGELCIFRQGTQETRINPTKERHKSA